MADDVEALVRRFEPILIFHPEEKFFPCDAKRYIEHCALWKAESPFDHKDSWGGKGQPFPRKPLIAHSKITASNVPGEERTGSTYLGTKMGSAFPFLADNEGEQHFLELAGWKDSPNITKTSKNKYANRDNLDNLYSTNPDLQDSRFWYHAELFSTYRLKGLMPHEGFIDTPPPLDFSKILGSLVNPALLCYYFFFPAHKESLPDPCTKFEETGEDYLAGLEYAGFAGEWACMAILLDRGKDSEPYHAVSVGTTGHFDVGSRQGLDGERRFGMSVETWRERADAHAELLPRTIGDHPQLFVSLGVHSLRLQPGADAIAPYLPEEAPIGCGEFDSPAALQSFKDSLPPHPESPQVFSAAGKAKVVAGFSLGNILGGIAGLALAGIEWLIAGGGGIDAYASGENPPLKSMTDIGPEATHLGQVLHPKGLSLSLDDFPNAKFVEWAADHIVDLVGRNYDFLVDRAAQIWWPSDDGASGYRGRWGPLVEDDPFHRRSGMLFPEFWRMFFVALAKHQHA